MKNNKKFGRVALVVALLVVVCIASIGGTIAWLTDKTGTVTNTFSASTIGLTLTETGVTLDGNKNGSKDFKMVPGNVIDKDPTVTVAAESEACYVFVKVNEENNLDKYITYAMAPGWNSYTNVPGVYYREVDAATAKNGVIFDVIGYTNTNDTEVTDDDKFVADKVVVNTSVKKEDMDALLTEGAKLPTLTFKAAAVQQANMTLEKAYEEVASFLNPTTTTP